MKTGRTAGVLVFCAMLASSWGFAQDTATRSEQKPTVSPTGSWTWDREGASGPMRCLLSISEKNGKIEGKFKDDEIELEIEKGSFKDGKLELFFLVDGDGQTVEVRLEGKVSEKEIKGTIFVQVDGGEQEIEWLATKTIALDDVAGRWRMSFTTPDGIELQPEFELKNTNGIPRVRFLESENGKISKVKFQEGKLTFFAAMVYEGLDVEVNYTLNLAQKNLRGLLSYHFKQGDPPDGELEITGSRIN